MGHGKGNHYGPHEPNDLICAEYRPPEETQDDVCYGKAHHGHKAPSGYLIKYP